MTFSLLPLKKYFNRTLSIGAAPFASNNMPPFFSPFFISPQKFVPVFLLFLFFALGGSLASAEAAPKLAGPFVENAVLQREKPIPVWGTASAGESLRVSLASQEKQTTADSEGNWRVEFDPMPAGGPHQLQVQGNGEDRVDNILIGEVWLAVGQSNMMMSVSKSQQAAEAAARMRDYPLMRFGTARALPDEVPEDFQQVSWEEAVSPNASATAFFFAEQLYNYLEGAVPVGILMMTGIHTAEAWSDPELIAQNPFVAELKGRSFPHETGMQFQKRTKPLSPYAIRGVLYYQGEMNGGRGLQYRELMPLVIESWRGAWGDPDLPFLFVQLPGFHEHKKERDESLDMDRNILAQLHQQSAEHGFTTVREAQLLTWLKTPNTGMAITIDVGDPYDIHPTNKQPVGERLFLHARKLAYGDEKVVISGPVPTGVEFENGGVTVTFQYVAEGMKAREGELRGFQLAGQDRVLHPADAEIDGDKIRLSSAKVSEPAILHYAWAGAPDANLVNSENLPATPFRFQRFDKMTNSVGEFQLSLPEFQFPQPEAPRPLNIWAFESKVSSPAEDAVVLESSSSSVFFHLIDLRTGFLWNTNPLDREGIRPGCIIGFSLQARATESGPARVYTRIAMDWKGSRANAFQDSVLIADLTTDPRTLHLATTTSPTPRESREFGFFLKNGEETPIEISKFPNAVEVIRPLLEINVPEMIEFKGGAANQSEESAAFQVWNGQKKTLLRSQEKIDNEDKAVASVLHGLADVPRVHTQQKVDKMGDGVGVMLLGPDVDRFEIQSAANVVDGKALVFAQSDGTPGLRGGENPDRLDFRIKFSGAPAGNYKATLRVVTQAMNLGTLSQGGENEPPGGLYYLDIPITARVETR